MELSKLSVHLSIVRGCVARMSMRAVWPGLGGLEQCFRAKLSWQRQRHARLSRDRVTRRSLLEREASIHRSKSSQTYIYLPRMSYLIVIALQQSISATHLTLHLSCTIQGYHMQGKCFNSIFQPKQFLP